MLNKLTGKGEDNKNRLLQYATNKVNVDNEEDKLGKNNPIRKKMHNLKSLDEDIKKSTLTSIKGEGTEINIKSPNLGPVKKYENEGLINIKNDLEDEKDEEIEIKNEGYLYKVTNN